MLTGKDLEVFRKIYQHCCDCQDLAESVGNWKFVDEFEIMRTKLNTEMYGL